jgi:hypothetical protein
MHYNTSLSKASNRYDLFQSCASLSAWCTELGNQTYAYPYALSLQVSEPRKHLALHVYDKYSDTYKFDQHISYFSYFN